MFTFLLYPALSAHTLAIRAYCTSTPNLDLQAKYAVTWDADRPLASIATAGPIVNPAVSPTPAAACDANSDCS